MTILLLLAIGLGVIPGAIGLMLGRSAPADTDALDLRHIACSALLCTLAYNLTFVWQEVWLVLPKALTPGLHPVLYHNDHDWTGTSPIVELLQGTGAIATMVSGLAALGAMRVAALPPTGRLLLFWLAYQGLSQSLTQLAIGAFIPQNDVGRALTYLGVAGPARSGLLAVAIVGLAAAGHALAETRPRALILPALLTVFLSIPFRVPRDPIEVVAVPALSIVIGLGWIVLMAAIRRSTTELPRAASIAGPLIAALVLLAFMQIVLRPGIAF